MGEQGAGKQGVFIAFAGGEQQQRFTCQAVNEALTLKLDDILAFTLSSARLNIFRQRRQLETRLDQELPLR